MESTINERISRIIDYYKLNNSSFSRKIDRQSQTVKNIVDGRSKPGFEVIEAILVAFPEINSEWLLLNRGQMLKEEKKAALGVVDSKLVETLYYTIDLQRQWIERFQQVGQEQLGKLFDVPFRQFSLSL